MSDLEGPNDDGLAAATRRERHRVVGFWAHRGDSTTLAFGRVRCTLEAFGDAKDLIARAVAFVVAGRGRAASDVGGDADTDDSVATDAFACWTTGAESSLDVDSAADAREAVGGGGPPD